MLLKFQDFPTFPKIQEIKIPLKIGLVSAPFRVRWQRLHRERRGGHRDADG